MTDRAPVIDRDSGLVEGWRAGDADAAVDAFARCGGSVRRFLARITGAADHELDDLVQQTFLIAHRSIHKFRGDSTLTTWLFGIALHASRRMRRGSTRRAHAYARLAELGSADAFSLDVEAREQLRLLASALGELDDDLRIAFVLCVLEDMPGKDAAALLGIPPGTLARRVHTARQRLRERVERAS